MGYIDGLRPKKDRGGQEREPVFSELLVGSGIEERHKERLDNIGSKFRERISHIPTKDEISQSLRKRANSARKLAFPRFTIKRTFVLLAIGILVLISLARFQLVSAKTDRLSDEAQSHIEKAFFEIDAGDLSKSLDEINLAKDKIEEMKMMAQSYGQDIQYFRLTPFRHSKLAADERLLDASYNIIDAMTDFSSAISASTTDVGSIAGNDYILDLDQASRDIGGALNQSRDKLLQSKSDLERISDSLSSDKKVNVEKAISVIDRSLASIDFFTTLASRDLPWLSGSEGESKKVLILFQNNAELRGGSGGSLGSFGIANFSDGKLTNIDFGKNIYKLDKPFAATTHIEPPEIIKYLNPNWVMKDSGWAVDGPEASQTIIDFYKKETGDSVDGVIMIDTSAVISLLKVTGPIDMKKYDKSISADNFRAELENEVHETYFDNPMNLVENEPKKIIGEMMPIFIEKVLSGLNSEDSAKILASLSSSLSKKDITFYFDKEDFQQNIEKLNYSGAVAPALGDYLYINNSNIAGEKSSLSVEESIKLNVDISDSGTITDQINLQREHKGTAKLPDGINKNFIRLLLPENSKINSFTPVSGNYEQMGNLGLKDGKPYWEGKDAGKLALNFWMTTNPGEKSELNFAYEPNYSVDTSGDFTYNLLIQKQPGANPDNVSITIHYPDGFSPANVKNYDIKKNQINFNFSLDKDRSYKIQFKKN